MALTKVQKEGIETLINNNADNRVITGSGTANTLNAESNVFIESNGRLGIGTSSPSYPLHVNSGTANSVSIFESTDEGVELEFKDSTGTSFLECRNDFRLKNSSGEKVRINSSGNVGIGTNSPDQKLHVANTSGGASILIETNNSSGGNILFGDDASSTVGRLQYVHSDNSMRLNTDGSERMRIDSSGNVGIGVTDIKAALQVNSIRNAETDRHDGSNYHLFLRNPADDTGEACGLAFSVTSNATKTGASILFEREGGGSIGSMQFYTNGDGNSVSERMRIASDGVITAQKSLLIGNTSDSFTALNITSSTSGISELRFADTTANAGFLKYEHSGNNLIFATNTNERMRLDTLGRLLISTTSTSAVTGGSAEGKFFDGNDGCRLMSSRASTNVREHSVFHNPNGTVGSITTSGSATAFNTSSDYRLKENIVTISDGITRLKTLKPSRFNFIADKETTVDGFLAHEVTAVPEAITGTKDEVDSDNNPVYQAIDQSKLVPLLTAALQEAVGKIEVLETKVAALEAA